MRRFVQHLKEYWGIYVFLVFLVSAISIPTINTVLQERQRRDLENTCKAANYMGGEYIQDHPVCYGYIDGNRLVVVPVADIKDGQ